jgi:hypothetical protein
MMAALPPSMLRRLALNELSERELEGWMRKRFPHVDIPGSFLQWLHGGTGDQLALVEAISHARLGLCWLETGDVDEARESAWGAMSVPADRDEWFQDREYIEILLARLDVIDGHVDHAAQRLGKAAGVLSTYDVYAWASVELERCRILAESDPDAARGILAAVSAATSGVHSALDRQIAEIAALLPAVSHESREQLA